MQLNFRGELYIIYCTYCTEWTDYLHHRWTSLVPNSGVWMYLNKKLVHDEWKVEANEKIAVPFSSEEYEQPRVILLYDCQLYPASV